MSYQAEQETIVAEAPAEMIAEVSTEATAKPELSADDLNCIRLMLL